MAGRSKKSRGWILWAAILVVVVVAFIWVTWQGAGLGTSRVDQVNGANPASVINGQSGTYATVTRGSLTATVYGEGSLAPAEKAEVYVSAEGEVSKVEVEEGDRLQKGDVLLRMENDDLVSKIAQLQTDLFSRQVELSDVRDKGSDTYVYAPCAGRLKVIEVEKDDDIAVAMKTKGRLAVISRDDKLKVAFEPAGDANLKVGDKVTVWIDSKAVNGVVEVTEGLAGRVAVTVEDDDYDLGEPALVTTLQGQKLGEGMLEINMPVPVTGIGGIIDKVYYEEYDSVKSGAKLFHVDGRIPSSDLQLALLNVENTRIDLDIALKKQSKLILRAPIDGVVTVKDAWAGQYLSNGSRVFSMQSSGDFKLKADVDELDVANVREGQRAQVRVDAFPGKTFTGTVSAISSVAKTTGGVATYEVTVTLESSGELRDGMTASLDIVTNEARGILLVPSDAIRSENGKTYVETGDGRKVTVETGISDKNNVEIVSGLEEGDLVRTRERTETQQVGAPFGGQAANRASN